MLENLNKEQLEAVTTTEQATVTFSTPKGATEVASIKTTISASGDTFSVCHMPRLRKYSQLGISYGFIIALNSSKVNRN